MLRWSGREKAGAPPPLPDSLIQQPDPPIQQSDPPRSHWDPELLVLPAFSSVDPPIQQPDPPRSCWDPELLVLPSFSVDDMQQKHARYAPLLQPKEGARCDTTGHGPAGHYRCGYHLTGARLRQPTPAANSDPPNPGAGSGGSAVLRSPGERVPERALCSSIAFTNTEPLIDAAAKNQVAVNPTNTVSVCHG